MNADLFELQFAGLFAVAVATAALALLVHFELGPAARLAHGGRMLLTAALGIGVIAFAIKLAIITTLANAPEATIAPLIAGGPSLPPDEPAEDRVSWRDYVWEALPQQPPAPADNPTTPERVALGERLFFDRHLSRDGTLSCGSCHDVVNGAGDDGKATSTGIGGQRGGRNAPTIYNTAFQAVLFWDGRAPTLEAQAKGPLVNPIEMGMASLAEVEGRVRADPSYRDAFARAFGDSSVTIDRIAKAIAAFERTLITPDTPYDRFVRGDNAALTPSQMRGMARFQSLGCINCHTGANFSGASVLARPANPYRFFPANPTPYQTRYNLADDTGKLPAGSARGLWRIPSLRNVALTAPYFHNGSVKDLREAVRVMASAQLNRVVTDDPNPPTKLVWSETEKILREVRPATVSESDIEDIVAFLHALTSDRLAARLH